MTDNKPKVIISMTDPPMQAQGETFAEAAARLEAAWAVLRDNIWDSMEGVMQVAGSSVTILGNAMRQALAQQNEQLLREALAARQPEVYLGIPYPGEEQRVAFAALAAEPNKPYSILEDLDIGQFPEHANCRSSPTPLLPSKNDIINLNILRKQAAAGRKLQPTAVQPQRNTGQTRKL